MSAIATAADARGLYDLYSRKEIRRLNIRQEDDLLIPLLERIERLMVERCECLPSLWSTDLAGQVLPTSMIAALPSSFVYFMFIKKTGLVKIGYSNDPIRRRDTLQGNSEEKIELLGIVNGTRADERAWHLRFTAKRVFGEWFKCDRALAEAILDVIEASGSDAQIAAVQLGEDIRDTFYELDLRGHDLKDVNALLRQRLASGIVPPPKLDAVMTLPFRRGGDLLEVYRILRGLH